MPRHDAEEVLRRLSRSLRPGGMFVLDVYAPRFFAALDGEQEWWVGHDFIAGRFPQLVLTEYFYYAREQTYARRDFICDTRTGTIHTFGVSGQAYALPELCGMIEAAGLNPPWSTAAGRETRWRQTARCMWCWLSNDHLPWRSSQKLA